MKHFSHSLDLFKKMCALGVPVDKFTISIAIKCCCQLYRTNDAFALLGYCFRRSIVPNTFIFNALLDGLILEDRILETEIFFKKLIKHKLCSQYKEKENCEEYQVKKDENGVNREVHNKDSDGFVDARGRRNNGRNNQFQQRKQLFRPKEKQVNEKENGDLKRQENGQDNMNKDKGKSIVNEQNNGGEGTCKTPSSEMSNDEQNVVQNAGNQSSNRTDKKLNKYADVGSVERQDNDADAVNGNNDTLYSNDNQKCQDEGDLCRNKNGKSISMEENIVKENEEVDIFILWKKQEEMIDMFVNNKRNRTDEELETWARYMCEWYTERWEAKWKSKCPIVGRSIWIID
ncbi:pentatricopeptide repeat protein [Artemisia annua]|uniref:Pentatricopeptide repeat protein n=1 Tax=Artemisia annua TaxID=35608 RepID=A0A2U1LSZ5_ARTAN|nr:pentatricopeptide repeat protein [Artemisia annua]